MFGCRAAAKGSMKMLSRDQLLRWRSETEVNCRLKAGYRHVLVMVKFRFRVEIMHYLNEGPCSYKGEGALHY